MSNDIVTSARGPGLVGLAISNLMYGASLAQSIHYAWYFPDDPGLIKSLVLFVSVADVLHLVGGIQYYWNMLVVCHRSDAVTCGADLTWGVYLSGVMTYVITFAVQSFYCHRVWIITGNKRSITVAVSLIAILEFMIGLATCIEGIRHGSMKFVYTSPLVPVAAGVSTLCDILVTGTIFQYLWKSELRSRTSVLRSLALVFVNMGTLTCLVSATVGVVYLAQGDHYWVASPAIVLGRCYVNSLLAVLNARRGIRERELMQLRNSIEIPSLSTIL